MSKRDKKISVSKGTEFRRFFHMTFQGQLKSKELIYGFLRWYFMYCKQLIYHRPRKITLFQESHHRALADLGKYLRLDHNHRSGSAATMSRHWQKGSSHGPMTCRAFPKSAVVVAIPGEENTLSFWYLQSCNKEHGTESHNSEFNSDFWNRFIPPCDNQLILQRRHQSFPFISVLPAPTPHQHQSDQEKMNSHHSATSPAAMTIHRSEGSSQRPL